MPQIYIHRCSKKISIGHSRAVESFMTVLILGSLFLPASSLETVTVARPPRRATSSWLKPRSLRMRIRFSDENNGLASSAGSEHLFV